LKQNFKFGVLMAFYIQSQCTKFFQITIFDFEYPRSYNQRLHLPILTFAWLSVRQYRSKNEARIKKAKLNIFIFRKD
jgi:hypothetical protein